MAVVAFHSHVLLGGFIGVDLFFALSGFLITSLLLHERKTYGDIHLGAFWARRALRLAPALVVAVAFAIVASTYLGQELRALWVAASLTYTSNFVIAFGDTYPIGLVSHTWSLAMEEQFYLLWPLILGAASRWGARAVAGTAGVLSVLAVVLRFVYTASHTGDPQLWVRIYFGPDMRLDVIAGGCVAGALLGLGPSPSRAATRAIAVAAAVGTVALTAIALSVPIREYARSPLLITVTSLSATAVVVGAAKLPALARVLSTPPLVGLGKISYGLYLVHVILFPLMMEQPLWMRWFVAIVLAAASYLWIEKPFLAFKGRFERKPKVAPVPA